MKKIQGKESGASKRLNVSIVIPTFNRPHLLFRLLTSISRQSFRNFEVIVVDDASADTQMYSKVIGIFKKKIKRFRYLREEIHHGAPYCRNKGILASKYSLLALTDDDDEWKPTKLQKQIAVYQKTNFKDLIYTWADVTIDGVMKNSWESQIRGDQFNKIIDSNFIPSSSVLIQKTSILRAGLFDEKFLSCQDWDMWVRMYRTGSKCDFVPSIEIVYNLSTKNSISGSSGAIYGRVQFLIKFLPALIHENFKRALILVIFVIKGFLLFLPTIVHRKLKKGLSEYIS